MFLTNDEVKELTGESTPKWQAVILQKMGIRFYQSSNAKESPKVVRAYWERNKQALRVPAVLPDVVKALTALESGDVVGLATTYPQVCGVYFLIDGVEIVYVGQSQNVIQRIAQHTNKTFTHISWILCPPEYLGDVEAVYIAKFTPKYNVAGVPNYLGSPEKYDEKQGKSVPNVTSEDGGKGLKIDGNTATCR